MADKPTLIREMFTTSRLVEFFSEKELTMQIGHPRHLWPLALCKELIDNALDAAETAGIAPEIMITVENDALTVRDNGPGLPPATLEHSLDYLVRVSDKAYYVSPTRGQLGNALKCVWAAPYVVDGEHGLVEVATHGQRHRIDVRLDRIAQAPRILHTLEDAPDVKTGTSVRLHWPDIASGLMPPREAGFYKPTHQVGNLTDLLVGYAMCNPHATLWLTWLDDPTETATATDSNWRKWNPSAPTSPHWYTVERLQALVAAYIAAERTGGRRRTVREFVAEFHGVSGSAKQKAVTDAAGLTGRMLHDLVHGDDVAAGPTRRLLVAMQAEARAVKPVALGLLGEAHLRTCLTRYMHTEPDSIRYRKVMDCDSRGLPFVLEVAFGIHTAQYEGLPATVVSGVNWAPMLSAPFRTLPGLLGAVRIDRHDPVIVAVHLAYPRVEFTDRGKGVLAHAG
jgi:DNA topoisomerase VI subunit B